ncbi:MULTISPECIES: hypothetical protein [unclassified Microcoleus]|uniref:hypothetical protein n=1 Tax=unclassified Microcoleus TaxID=2642155 RepID=UPI002FD156C1
METNRSFEQSDTWSEEDCLDVTTFSLQLAATIVHSDPEILGEILSLSRLASRSRLYLIISKLVIRSMNF